MTDDEDWKALSEQVVAMESRFRTASDDVGRLVTAVREGSVTPERVAALAARCEVTLRDLRDVREMVDASSVLASGVRDLAVQRDYERERSESLTRELLAVKLGQQEAVRVLAMVVALSDLAVIPKSRVTELAWLAAHAFTLVNAMSAGRDLVDAVTVFVNNAIVIGAGPCPACGALTVTAHEAACAFHA